PIPIRRLRLITALLSTLLLLAGPVFALSAAPAAAATTGSASADDGQDDVSITLDEVTPWIDAKGTLTVRGLISNPTEKPIEKPSLDLEMSTRTLDSGSRLSSWKKGQAQHRTIADFDDHGPEARKKAKDDGDTEESTGTAVDATFDDRIDAGSSYEFTFTVPADELGLSTSSPVDSWGPRGLAVQLGDESGLRASEIGFTTWYPGPEFDQPNISMRAPVTLPGHSPGGIIDPDRLDEAIGEGGELARIRKLLKNKELGLAVDPRVIASFEAAVAEPPADGEEPEDTEEPGDEGTETPQAAVAD